MLLDCVPHSVLTSLTGEKVTVAFYSETSLKPFLKTDSSNDCVACGLLKCESLYSVGHIASALCLLLTLLLNINADIIDFFILHLHKIYILHV